MALLSSIFRTVAESLKLVNKQKELNNTPEMQAAKEKQDKQNKKEKFIKDIKEKNIENIRENLS